MTFTPDLNACAALVQRADPDRFLATMAAPVSARRVLFPLWAFNVEVSRAPWVTAEPMIAEMRLQWWRDALEEIAAGTGVRRHEVVTPLADAVAPDLACALDATVAARRWDVYRDPFEDAGQFEDYLDKTSGTLLWAATRALGDADEAVVRDFAFAAGVAGWLRAIPELEARGRIPLLDGTPDGVRALAAQASDRLARARRARSKVSPEAAPALLSGWQAGDILRQAVREPDRVARGALGLSEARRRLSLMIRAASGRW